MTSSQMEPMTVGRVAELGLLTPSERSPAGYRLYTGKDLERLGTIVGYRRLGFSLEAVRELLAADGQGRLEHLRRQRAEVMARMAQMTDLVAAIDTALEAEMTDRPATTEDLKGIFGDGYRDEYQDEAEQRWGDTPQWRQSQERTACFTPARWQEIKDETEALEAAVAQAAREGVDPTSDEGAALAERHRASIETFYDCSYEHHVRLAEMYLEDERFRQHYDDRAPGLAQWVHDAIVANARRGTSE